MLSGIYKLAIWSKLSGAA